MGKVKGNDTDRSKSKFSVTTISLIFSESCFIEVSGTVLKNVLATLFKKL